MVASSKARELRPDVGNGHMLEKQLWRGGDTKRGLKPCVSTCSDSPELP